MAGRRNHQMRRENPLEALAKSAGIMAGMGLAAAGSWIAYSNLAIDHQVPLEKAIDAELRSIPSEDFGPLAVYADRTAATRPLVLIHSVNAAASSYEMAPIFNRFRGKRPVFALDLPGFGFSDRSDRIYSPRLYQEAILEALHTQAEQPADVVALSLGCEFAARAAAIEPEAFHSLTFISPTGFNRPDAATASQRAGQQDRGDRLHDLFATRLWAQPLYDLIATRPSIRYFLEMSFTGPVPEALIDYDYATSHQPGARYAPLYFISGKLFTRGILPAFYERLELPVLVVYDQDAFTSFDRLPEVAAAHSNWRTVRIAPSRGLPQFEQMDRLAEVLDGFWSGLES